MCIASVERETEYARGLRGPTVRKRTPSKATVGRVSVVVMQSIAMGGVCVSIRTNDSMK